MSDHNRNSRYWGIRHSMLDLHCIAIFEIKYQNLYSLSHLVSLTLKTRSMSAPTVVLLLVLLYTPSHLPRQPVRRVVSAVLLYVDRHITHVCFWINLHLWHRVIVFHVFLTDVPAILHNLDSLAEIIGCNCAGLNRSFGNEGD